MKAIANTTIRLGLVNLPVQIVQATETANDISFKLAGPDGEALKQVYVKEGTDDIVPKDEIQKGIFDGGEFFPVSADDIENIKDQTKMPDLEVIEVIDMEDFLSQFHRVTGMYYVQNANSRTGPKGNINSLKLFVDALAEDGKAIVTKWTARSRQKLMVLYPENGILRAASMSFASDVREADDGVRAHLAGQYKPEEMAMAKQLLGVMGDTKKNALEMMSDDALPLMRQLVEDVCTGRALPERKVEVQATVTTALADALAASLAAMKDNEKVAA